LFDGRRGKEKNKTGKAPNTKREKGCCAYLRRLTQGEERMCKEGNFNSFILPLMAQNWLPGYTKGGVGAESHFCAYF